MINIVWSPFNTGCIHGFSPVHPVVSPCFGAVPRYTFLWPSNTILFLLTRFISLLEYAKISVPLELKTTLSEFKVICLPSNFLGSKSVILLA